MSSSGTVAAKRGVERRFGGGVQRYVDVTHTLAAREFVARYRGNLMGTVTAVLIPVLFLATYTFVFTTIIPIRLRESASLTDYAFFLFAGLVAFNTFAEPVGRAPRVFVAGSNFVHTSHFPASCLAAVPCLASFYQALVWLAAFAAVRLVTGYALPASILLAPLMLAWVALLAAGVSLVIGTAGVFVRDLGELIGPALVLALFVSPVLYPAERVREVAPWLLDWNPVAPLVVMLRSVALQGELPELFLVGRAFAWTSALLLLGTVAYRRIRSVLGDLV